MGGRFCYIALVWSVLSLAATTLPAPAQDLGTMLGAGGGGEEEAPPVTAAEVEAALLEILQADEGPPPEAITADDPEIDLSRLDLLLKPLTQSQLRIEISAWDALFKEAVARLTAGEVELLNLTEAEAAAAEEAGEEGDGQEGEEAEPQLSPEHEALIEANGELRSERIAVADRLRLVMDTFEAKGGDPAETTEIRTYISSVSGVEVDVSDAETAILTLQEWAFSEDGGLRLLRNAVIVIGATVVGYLLGWAVGLVLSFGLGRSGLTSRLLVKFIRSWMGRIGALAGILMGLSQIGTNMTPILAGLGALGFILAFALQNTISNFASGLLILLQRPFDAGDEIEAAGITGIVEQVSLFTTHLSTAENRKVIVPNNMIWEDVITNSTGAETRRLQIEVEVNSEEHSLEEAEEILMKVMKAHDGVLNDPAPDLKLSAMTAESYTFVCWPWVKTEDKDSIRWELVSQFGREMSVLKGVTKSENA